jgi:hypothetical protein
MNPNVIKTYRMSPQTLLLIDQHERANFTKPTRLYDRIVAVLPSHGEVMLKYVIGGSDDSTITIVYEMNGVEDGKRIVCRQPGCLGYELLIHAMTTAVIWEATNREWEFPVAYQMAQLIASQIDLSDKSTLPEYVEHITPMMISENVDLSFDVYRSCLVGEQRSEDWVQVNRALVRYIAKPTDATMDNNFREIFPVLRVGNYVTFNGFVPFTAQIIGPMSNESTLPAAERYGLHFKDSVMVEDLRTTPRILNVQTGELTMAQS